MMCEHGASDNDCDAGFPTVCAYPGCGYFGHDEHSAPDYCSRHKPAEPIDLPPSDDVEIEPDDDDICRIDGCGTSIDDGEGWDGMCGFHADLAEEDGDDA